MIAARMYIVARSLSQCLLTDDVTRARGEVIIGIGGFDAESKGLYRERGSIIRSFVSTCADWLCWFFRAVVKSCTR